MTTYAGRAIWPTVILDSAGNARAGERVWVYLRGTTTLATLYADRTKASTIANPTVVDADGNLNLFCDPGEYDAVILGDAIPVTAVADPSEPGGGGGAPTTATYLVATADAGLSAEIVVGTSPGGELGGTWSAPTVDATHSGSQHADFVPLTQRGAANGVATLDSGSKIPSAQIPAVAISDYLGNVASQAAMLALVGQRGDWCTRSDLSATFILITDDPTQVANWKQLATPAGGVSSVNGRSGAVTGLAELAETVTTVDPGNSAVTAAPYVVTSIFNPTAAGTCTVTFDTTGAVAGKTTWWKIRLQQRASGNSAIAFAGGTRLLMNDGTTPQPSQVANAVALYVAESYDGGSTIQVWKVGDSTDGTTVPGAPTIGTATAGDTTATITWTAPGSNGGSAITGYQVTLYKASDNSVISTVTVGVVLTKQFTGLTNSVGVYGKAAAINANGPGPQSAASNTVTPAASGGFSDNFNRSDSTTLGNSWGQSGTNIQVVSNQAKVVSYAGGTIWALHETGLADGAFSWDITDFTSGEIDLYCRAASTANPNDLLQLLLQHGTLYLQRVISGTGATETFTTYTNPGAPFTVTATLASDKITVVINGVTVLNNFTLSGAAAALAGNTKAGFGGSVLESPLNRIVDNFAATP